MTWTGFPTDMVLDSSAVIAILQSESDADRLLDAFDRHPARHISAATLLEASIVLTARFGDAADRELDLLLHAAGVDVVSVTPEQTELARSTWKQYGKGRHPAGLNFGDCFSYALAMSLGEPLLFTGQDFSKTDVVPA